MIGCHFVMKSIQMNFSNDRSKLKISKIDYSEKKRINKNVSNDEMSFTETLDPGQTTLVNIFTVFWGLYIGNIGSTINSDSEYATKMKKDISKIRYPEFPSLEGTNIGKLSQTQYLASVIKVNILQTRFSGQ